MHEFRVCVAFAVQRTLSSRCRSSLLRVCVCVLVHVYSCSSAHLDSCTRTKVDKCLRISLFLQHRKYIASEFAVGAVFHRGFLQSLQNFCVLHNKWFLHFDTKYDDTKLHTWRFLVGVCENCLQLDFGTRMKVHIMAKRRHEKWILHGRCLCCLLSRLEAQPCYVTHMIWLQVTFVKSRKNMYKFWNAHAVRRCWGAQNATEKKEEETTHSREQCEQQ